MLGRRQIAIAWAVTLTLAAAASAQTTGGTGGGTGAGGGAGGTGGAGGGAGGGSVTTGGGSTANRGGASGAGMSGNSGSPFAGVPQSGFGGGNANSTATNTGGSTSSNAVPTTNNPWRTTYGNVYSLGQSIMGAQSGGGRAGATTSKGFGQPIFTTATTSVTTTTATTKAGFGYTNTNLNRTPRYTTVLGEDFAPIVTPPAALQSKLQDTVSRSSALKSRDQIRVAVDGDVVVLTGFVASERERGLAENVLRLTPGVNAIANQLVVRGAPPQP